MRITLPLLRGNLHLLLIHMSTSHPKVEDWHKLNCRLFWAYEGPVRPKFQHGAYRQEGIVAWLIIRGSVRLTFAKSRESCTAGNWYFPKGEPWTQDFSPDAEILSLRFIAHWPDETPLFDRTRSLKIPASAIPRLTSLARRMARHMSTTHIEDERGFEQVPKSLDRYIDIQRLFLSWMTSYVDLMREQKIPSSTYQTLDERVWIAINRIERAEMHEPLRETELALLAGVSKSHLNRLFVINTGKTPADYWADRRIQAARSALLESSRSVKSIAYELGFSSLSHFSTWVRKKTGISPRALRKTPAKKKRSSVSGSAPASPHLVAPARTKRPR